MLTASQNRTTKLTNIERSILRFRSRVYLTDISSKSAVDGDRSRAVERVSFCVSCTLNMVDFSIVGLRSDT